MERWLTLRVAALASVAAGLVGTPPPVAGATFTAQNCSSTAVQTAINSAVSGDTVIVPIGSCSWTSGVTIDGKAIHLRGQTAGSVSLTHNSSSYLLALVESTAGPIRVSQLEFRAGTGQLHTIRMLRGSVSARAMLIHDNAWVGAVNAIRAETNRGVIYRNTMNANGADRSFVQCKAEGMGVSGWEKAHTIGTADTTGESNLYLEDNSISRVPYQAMDSDSNCRVAVRHNVFQDTGYTSHGPDTSPVGNRHTEIYDNTFGFTNNGCAPAPVLMDYFIFVRGGTWVITDNVIPDLKSCYMGDKAQIKFQVQNLRRNSGPMPCWTGGYPMPRQIGDGHTGTSYVSDPVYMWGNTAGGTTSPVLQDYSPDECGGGASISQFVQAGRDFFNGLPRPGYQKYTYPHPLRSGQTPPNPQLPPRAVGPFVSCLPPSRCF